MCEHLVTNRGSTSLRRTRVQRRGVAHQADKRALEIMTACITYGLVQIRGLLQYRGDYSMKSVVFNFHKIEENKQSCSAYVFQVGNILIVSV